MKPYIKELASNFDFCITDLITVEDTNIMTVYSFQKDDSSSYMYIEIITEDINTLKYNVLVDNNYILFGVIKNDEIQ
jgi:hypothetical protein